MPKTANKPVIAVDIDDVLAANAEGFVEFSNRRWGTNLTPDDYTEHWAEMWRVDFAEVDKRRETLLKEKVFTKHRFFADAKPVLETLRKDYHLIILSSRRKEIEKDTLAWLDKEFGDLFEKIYFAGIWDRHELHILKRLDLTKADMLKEVGAEYLIDDQPKHCLAAAEAGVTALLFGDYGWNRSTELVNGMFRVNNWQEVREFFDAKS